MFTEDGRRVEPGSGESGMVAVSGFIPLGYYKDAVKTAATFRTFEGMRWSVPGDWAEVNADGTLHLLGRGSVCINTGGEKVFPEEVEEVLKTHEAVRDAVCVGIPDERFGETICAVVEAESPGDDLHDVDLAAHVKTKLAAYKAPRQRRGRRHDRTQPPTARSTTSALKKLAASASAVERARCAGGSSAPPRASRRRRSSRPSRRAIATS